MLLGGVRKMEVVVEPLDMGAIVAEAQQRLAHLVSETGAEITLPAAWPVALGHGPWVEEVWANYISNACKYGGRPPEIDLGFTILDSRLTGSQEGRSTIENPKAVLGLSRRERAAGSKIKFWVRDNGVGLSPKQRAMLFVPFTRLAQAQVEGYGLGLSIVHRIMDKLGGEVGVESEPGAGSTFYFVLPAGPEGPWQ